jgi:hypothetical protein
LRGGDQIKNCNVTIQPLIKFGFIGELGFPFTSKPIAKQQFETQPELSRPNLNGF